ALDARSLGFLDASDPIVMNRDRVIDGAQAEAIEMAEQGYAPPAREKNCYAAGRDVAAALKAAIYIMREGAYISDQAASGSSRIASILCGGELSSGQWVDEQFFLAREREGAGA
ncbi:MAG TPA: 3-hydroxyacyl-CoA dehydrogenase/enoyl-CoA hydratase family protein, partial [Thermoanaerobaculia bacterium]|nr:3-hydroxyacyl-CoA dehydrogenase/enoyl-CoA hydratase family protein [Thermoanaerobaculia bacterium]